MRQCRSGCAEWARQYMDYCLCSVRDEVSLSLGLISIISWAVADVPQLITNHHHKSPAGLSFVFLFTWIVGDLFNLVGCMMEPATLPMQYYTALFYTIITSSLALQSMYYRYIYHWLKSRRLHNKEARDQQTDEWTSFGICESGANGRRVNGNNIFSSPIPLPSNKIHGEDVYFTSARSLSSSHTPTAGSFLPQRLSPTSSAIQSSIEEPLINEVDSTKPAEKSNIKTTLCISSTLTFLAILNLCQSTSKGMPERQDRGIVMQVGRRTLQVGNQTLRERNAGTSGFASFLGWGMSIIYTGGRLPQICLNIKRGSVVGLNPLMFVFALIGNSTYVASIFVNSIKWEDTRPNLPWIVDAIGCVLLDTFILLQFVYFRYRTNKTAQDKQ